MRCAASSPLVPQRETVGGNGVLAVFGLTVAFTAITTLIVFIKGRDHYHSGFIVMGVALLCLFLATTFLLNLIRTDTTLAPSHRRLALFQSLSLLFLCISILVVLYQPSAPCPHAPATCNLGQLAALQPAAPCVIPPQAIAPCWAAAAASNGPALTLYTAVNQSCPCAFLQGTASGGFNCSR